MANFQKPIFKSNYGILKRKKKAAKVALTIIRR